MRTHGGYLVLRLLKGSKRLDHRYGLVKQVEQVRENLIEDVGGLKKLSQGQSILLDRIIEKIYFLSLISQFVFQKKGLIINERGELLPCLGSNFLAYSNSLRLDLESFYAMAKKQPSKTPNLDEYLKSLKQTNIDHTED